MFPVSFANTRRENSPYFEASAKIQLSIAYILVLCLYARDIWDKYREWYSKIYQNITNRRSQSHFRNSSACSITLENSKENSERAIFEGKLGRASSKIRARQLQQ